MVLMASKQEKSERERSQRLSVFARAIHDSVTVRGAGRSLPSPTLDEFQGIVIRDVEMQTGRRQKADFYPPEHIRPRLIRIFEPQLRPSEAAGRSRARPQSALTASTSEFVKESERRWNIGRVSHAR